MVALGSTHLVVRDIQNQAITQMMALATNPAYASLINLKKLFERALKAQHIDPADIMNTEAEIKAAADRAAQNQQPDPRLAAAQVRAEADKDRTQAQVQMNEISVRAKHEAAMAEHQLRRETLQMEREIEMMKLANKENVSLEQIRANLAAVGIKERTKQDMQATEIKLAQTRGEGI